MARRPLRSSFTWCQDGPFASFTESVHPSFDTDVLSGSCIDIPDLHLVLALGIRRVEAPKAEVTRLAILRAELRNHFTIPRDCSPICFWWHFI